MANQGKVAWDSVEAWQKLLAAVFATVLANGQRVDVSSVATHFGATYDTIENRLRPVKRQAKELQEAVGNGTQGKVTSARKSPSKPKTPRKSASALETVFNSRVTKKTPSKKTTKKDSIKQEAFENSFSSMIDDDFADSESNRGEPEAVDSDDGLDNMFG